ncbi:MAG TPA: cupin domain-containing protein [Solirubrobacteraceae bacterium]|jgi:uncharacterized cupin superfamily protein
MIRHWDDEPWVTIDRGDLRCERQRLCSTQGAPRAALSRYRIAPGQRPTPQHVHADEEEIFFVLAGSGLSWQDDAVHEIAAGDVLVHLAGAEAHTLVAGPDEALEVLAFSSGSPTHLTTLPRAGVTWVGARWLPPDAPHPFAAEPPAGELPAPTPRPPTIVALEDVEMTEQDKGRVHRVRRDLGRAAGSVLSGMKHVEVPPGRRSSTRHCHSLEDEIFVVLGGGGAVLLDDEAAAVRPGSVVYRPRGTGVAHTFEASDDGLTLLAYGTREPDDTCWYPDSNKLFFGGVKVIARVEPLDYWDGEQ